MNKRTVCPPHGSMIDRRGMVLLAVLVVLVILTLAAYQYAELMTAEYQAVDSYRRSAQARAMAESGIHYTAALLVNAIQTGTPLTSLYDDSGTFGARMVKPGDQPRRQARFSVVAAYSPDDIQAGQQGFRYGITDENGKINLNALLILDSSGQIGQNMLIQLPNMTEDIVNSILDWIDPDDTPRANGAENSYYSSLNPPYRCKNGPLDSMDELLLVRSMTPQLLWGNDWDRNGSIDPGQTQGAAGLDTGLSAYVTMYSREQNVDSQGNPRIFLNDTDLNGLADKLTTAVGGDLANYILAYRLYGPAPTATVSKEGASTGRPKAQPKNGSSGGQPSGGGTPKSGSGSPKGGSSSGKSGGGGNLSRGTLNMTKGQPRSISSMYELVNSQVSVPGDNPGSPATVYASPLNDLGSQRKLLPILFDKVTTVLAAEIPGRINVNTAPNAVLTALPGLSSADVQNILMRRASMTSTDPIYQSPTWLLTEANVAAKTMQSLEKYVTARSQVYRIQSVGYFDGGGPTARVEAIIDLNNGTPRFLYWRDLTELGRGFNLSGTNNGRN